MVPITYMRTLFGCAWFTALATLIFLDNQGQDSCVLRSFLSRFLSCFLPLFLPLFFPPFLQPFLPPLRVSTVVEGVQRGLVVWLYTLNRAGWHLPEPAGTCPGGQG